MILVLLAIAAILVVVYGATRVEGATPATTSSGKDYTGTNAGLVPSTFSLAGKTHYYQVPKGTVKGTFMFLPGCARAATGFWPTSTQAPECTGFPEDVSHTKQALRSGYAILVPTPLNPNLCFNAENTENIAPIVKQFFQLTGLGSKPLYLGGCSAGGGLAMRYQKYVRNNSPGIKFSGLLLECATSSAPLDGGSVPADFPPCVWVCMSRDTGSQQQARQYAASLKSSGVGSAVIVSPKRLVTPHYFSDRMSSITPAESAKITQGLKTIGLVDSKGSFLQNPKQFSWMPRLKTMLPAGKQFTLGSVRNSPICQAVLVAYGRHEHIADYTTAALKFFESKGKASMKELLSKHTVRVPAAIKV